MENLCATDNTTLKSCTLESCTPILHPIVIGAPETSISLDSETTSLSDSESENESPRDVLPFSSPGHHGMGPISTINVQGSSDVVIGPMTQFHGPVTIYQRVTSNTQNHNGLSLENSKSEDGGDNVTIHGVHEVNDQKYSIVTLIKSKTFRWVLSTCAILAVICIVVIPIVYLIRKTNDPEKNDPGVEHNNSTASPGSTLHMYNREEWSAKPSNFTERLKHPTQFAVVCHSSGSFCTDFYSCSTVVRNIQNNHMQDKNKPDIGYNFLIGGDGEIYVGRGWDVVNSRSAKSIEVCMIGDFSRTKEPTVQMISTLSKLLELGEKTQRLASDYNVVCHNQTENTASPGEHVCKEIMKFSHYYPGKVKL